MSPTAVHFGAGNIGRGFVGLILHRAGYEVVFADVAETLIDALQVTPSYQVIEVGLDSRTERVDNYRAINSRSHDAELVRELAAADIVTTAVGPTVLKFVAPTIAAALLKRSADQPPLAVMACENAINATDVLAGHIREHCSDEEWAAITPKAVFANTAVDRIVPAQAADAGLDVTVETYFEWAIESPPFGSNPPEIPDATWVPDLAPYIERKLFTVNTGHATTAYHGRLRGISKLSDALADEQVRADSVYAAHGATASRPVQGETLQAYRRRLAQGLQKHSPAWKGIDLSTLPPPALEIATAAIYADAAQAARNPVDVPEGTLREVVSIDSTGRRITSFVGEPRAWMDQFGASRRRVTGISNGSR